MTEVLEKIVHDNLDNCTENEGPGYFDQDPWNIADDLWLYAPDLPAEVTREQLRGHVVSWLMRRK